jgi:hypothetical protein
VRRWDCDRASMQYRQALPGCTCICQRSHTICSSDAGRPLYDAAAMDEKAARRAALVTLRRSIVERFPPEPERRAWLRWAAGLAKSSTPQSILVPQALGRHGPRQCNGWTPERRRRQSELIRQFRPWEWSTGPCTPEGKALAAKNGYRGAGRQMLRSSIPTLRKGGQVTA